mmetsp:Transcript_6833/g.17683  ORF Transcript_6833/g.17683 Transcript_6833/m.17683 type:complete len:318 (-) Transcript_6833:118-1071(-)
MLCRPATHGPFQIKNDFIPHSQFLLHNHKRTLLNSSFQAQLIGKRGPRPRCRAILHDKSVRNQPCVIGGRGNAVKEPSKLASLNRRHAHRHGVFLPGGRQHRIDPGGDEGEEAGVAVAGSRRDVRHVEEDDRGVPVEGGTGPLVDADHADGGVGGVEIAEEESRGGDGVGGGDVEEEALVLRWVDVRGSKRREALVDVVDRRNPRLQLGPLNRPRLDTARELPRGYRLERLQHVADGRSQGARLGPRVGALVVGAAVCAGAERVGVTVDVAGRSNALALGVLGLEGAAAGGLGGGEGEEDEDEEAGTESDHSQMQSR